MDPVTILADVQIAISLGKLAIQVGESALPFLIVAEKLIFEQRSLTDVERADMLAKEKVLRDQLQVSVPSDETDPE